MDNKRQPYKDEKIQESKYIYEGPVFCYGKVISKSFKANTFASSLKKASSNIKDQYKRWYGFTKTYKIEIDDKLIKKL